MQTDAYKELSGETCRVAGFRETCPWWSVSELSATMPTSGLARAMRVPPHFLATKWRQSRRGISAASEAEEEDPKKRLEASSTFDLLLDSPSQLLSVAPWKGHRRTPECNAPCYFIGKRRRIHAPKARTPGRPGATIGTDTDPPIKGPTTNPMRRTPMTLPIHAKRPDRPGIPAYSRRLRRPPARTIPRRRTRYR